MVPRDLYIFQDYKPHYVGVYYDGNEIPIWHNACTGWTWHYIARIHE